MTTGTILQANLPIAGSVMTDTATLIKCINAAIAAASPTILLTEYVADLGTLASSTYEYALSTLDGTTNPLPYIDYGISRVLIDEDSSDRPEALHRRDVRQRYDQSTGVWTLVFKPSTCVAWTGKSFSVQYHYEHPLIAALNETINLPLGYLIPATRYQIALYKVSLGPNDAAQWRDLMAAGLDDTERARRAHRSAQMQPLLQARKERLT